jgi:hypothetical protein
MTRGETGRPSAGPRLARRSLVEPDLLAEREFWRAQPLSLERMKNLARIRRQLASIRNRVES